MRYLVVDKLTDVETAIGQFNNVLALFTAAPPLLLRQTNNSL